MVRKWSYIKLAYYPTNLTSHLINNTFKRYKFKVFRATTRFKKYVIGDFTRIVRKVPVQLKRKTSLVNISAITSHWITHYLKLRQLNRFIQNIKLFHKQSKLPNIVVFNKTINTLKCNEGINVITCSWKIFKNLPNNNYSKLKGPYNTNSFILTSESRSYKQLELVKASVTAYDRCMYPININSNTISTNCTSSLLPKEWLYTNITYKVISVRKLAITLTLKHLSK